MNIKIIKLVLLMLFFGSFSMAQNTDEVKTVTKIDLSKYVGTWYEIAKIPNSFQKKYDSNTTANYELRQDGRINVINRCLDNKGNIVKAKGIAKVVDSDSNAKLKVSFFNIFGWYLFWGDYWIIGIGDNYEYAVIGHSERKYGWILAREKNLTEDMLQEAFLKLKQNGYNTDKFQFTKQN